MQDCVDAKGRYILKKHMSTLKLNKPYRKLSNSPDKMAVTFLLASTNGHYLEDFFFFKTNEKLYYKFCHC